MTTAVIIDDEANSRETLTKILAKYAPEVQVLGQAGNARDAYELILASRPQLIFLDVSMPHENGFDLLKRFDDLFFEVIFVTAYEQYAMQAIKACALDFLLKPLDIQEVVAAVNKAKLNISQKQYNSSLKLLLDNLNSTKTAHNKLAVPTATGLDFITMADIVRLEADSNYTVIHLSDRRKIVSTRHLKEYEEMLPSAMFFRAHHSHIINISFVVHYQKGEGGYVKMVDGSEVDIAKRKKKDFLALFAM